MLVTYVVKGCDRDSRHSSIWNVAADPPVLHFHQGTFIDSEPTPHIESPQST
jgi:hypothetical protein